MYCYCQYFTHEGADQVTCPGSHNQVSSGELHPDSLTPGPDKLKHYYYYYYFKLIAILSIYLFIYLFLAVSGLRFVRGLSLVAASGGHSSSWCGGHSSSRCAGLSLSRPLLLRGTGSRRAGSAVVAHGPSCSAACGIFPDQGSNPCPLH